MKKVIYFLLAIAATSCQDFVQEPSATVEDNSATTLAEGSDGQKDYYWYQGEKIYLTRNNEFVNVITPDGKLTKSSKSEVADNSKTRSEQSKYVMPFFERGEGIEPIGTSDIFYLKLKSPEDVEMLKKMAAELGVQVIEEIPYTPRWYTLSILGSDFSSSIEASNHFYETGRFEDVDPAFMFDFKPSADDPEFWRQWGMVSSSTYDINVVPAWNITRGAGVKVAVVDTPIQSNHTDLDGNIHSLSYNAKLKQTPSAPYGGNSHGTHVAGIIAAEKNGSMVTGVAYEAKIVRVSHDMSATNTIASELASGINWAWRATSVGGAGVDVINCSWGDQGGQAYGQLHSSVLESAISDAMTLGRGGKGCVVVFASGNYGHTNPGRIDYPGSFHSGILVVGGIDENGSRRYSSSYGTQLDVVAPGGSIRSTVYNNATGNMSGTSMAAPHVSGIAALLLSAYPNFTRGQVENAIIRSASSYPSRTNDRGYGLVNALKALFGTVTMTLSNVGGSSYPVITSCSNSTATLSISNGAPNYTITWRGTPGIQIVSGQGTKTLTFRKKVGSTELNSALYADIYVNGTKLMGLSSTRLDSAPEALTSISVMGGSTVGGMVFSLIADPQDPLGNALWSYEWRSSDPDNAVLYYSSPNGGIGKYEEYLHCSKPGIYYIECRPKTRCGSGQWIGIEINAY